jgi:hypothetical protein
MACFADHPRVFAVAGLAESRRIKSECRRCLHPTIEAVTSRSHKRRNTWMVGLRRP